MTGPRTGLRQQRARHRDAARPAWVAWFADHADEITLIAIGMAIVPLAWVAAVAALRLAVGVQL